MGAQVTRNCMSELPYIRAIDFDGTIVEDKFPEIGAPNWSVIETLKAIQNGNSAKLILWTCRTERRLEEAVIYCRDVLGIVFDAVNENIPEVIALFGKSSRKVYANEYWDDKAVVIQAMTHAEKCLSEHCNFPECPEGCTCKGGPSYMCQP